MMKWVDGKDGQLEGAAQSAENACAARASRRRGAVEEGETQVGPEGMRIFELEVENHRLTRLVADLLLKNQRLRESN